MQRLKMHGALGVLAGIGLLLFAGEGGGGPPVPTPDEVVARMRGAYQRIPGYQCETEVVEYLGGEPHETRRFLYAFLKPHRFRIEMHTPHRGAVLICCDSDGKIVVRPGGFGSFLTMRLAPDNRFFRSASGQRIDQTDLGLLIAHIGESVAEHKGGEVDLREEEGAVLLETVAADHFLPGITTRYRFLIDKRSWLPSGVVELTPDGVLKRLVSFKNLQQKGDFPAGYFDTGK